jgi:ABC-2 type transport system permease protein
MLKLYLRLVGARIRAQMQYKLSFWLELLGFLLLTGTEFGVLAILMGRFHSVAGWTLPEVALLYGLSATAFGLAETVGRGFDSPFELMMQKGSFDMILSRPQGSFFQILASEFQLRRLGRSLQGLAVLCYAFAQLDLAWTPAKALLLPLTIASGTLIYIALTVIGATVCFWTIKTPEVINVFTAGGDYMASYPLSIYSRPLRAIFLYIVPVAFANYPAALLLLERADSRGLPASLAWAAPLVALAFFAVALRVWRVGVSKYQSTGS